MRAPLPTNWRRRRGSIAGRSGRGNAVKSANGSKGTSAFHPIRIALTGRAEGPEWISSCRRSIVARSCRTIRHSEDPRVPRTCRAVRRALELTVEGSVTIVVTKSRLTKAVPFLCFRVSCFRVPGTDADLRHQSGLEALRAGRVKELRVSERASGGSIDAVKAAERDRIAVRRVTPANSIACRAAACIRASPPNCCRVDRYDVDDLVQAPAAHRSSSSSTGSRIPITLAPFSERRRGRGDRVIRQSRAAAPLDGAAAKASAGRGRPRQGADVVNMRGRWRS
jgi:hypothetical protein